MPSAAPNAAGSASSRMRNSTPTIGIIACGAIVRELMAVARQLNWRYELTAIPAQLHNRPERIAPTVAAHLDEWAARFDLILVGYGECGTGGALDALLARYPHVVRILGPHCYEFYGGADFARQAEAHLGTFYLTDFLAHHFDALVWRGLGLDRHPELRDLYFGHYTHLMYIKQLPEQNEERRAREAAERLGLQYVEINSSLTELESRLTHLVEAQVTAAAASGRSESRAV